MSEGLPDLASYTVAQLKTELSKRGLPTSGKKQDLISKLLACFGNSEKKPKEVISASSYPKENEGTNVPLSSPQSHKGSPCDENADYKQPVVHKTIVDSESKPGIDLNYSSNGAQMHLSQPEAAHEDKNTSEVELKSPNVTESEKRLARSKRFGLSEPPSSKDVLSTSLDVDLDKLLLRKKRFRLSEDCVCAADGGSNADSDSFEAARQEYLLMKKRQERWGTTDEEAKKAFYAIEEKYKRFERKKRFSLVDT